MAAYLNPDKTVVLNGLKVNQFFLTSHNPNKISLPQKRTKKLIGVTIHNTDWIKVNSAATPAEQYTRATVNGNMGSVRVHYYTDNICAWQNLPLDYESWHAADGRGNGNTATISVECIMDGSNNSYNEKSRDNAARLAAYLLYSNGLTAENLYTHTYWLNVRDGKTGTTDYLNTLKHPYKWCPLYILPNWTSFKALVNSYIVALGGKSTVNSSASETTDSANKLPYCIKILDSTMNIRKDAGTNNPIVCVVKKNEVYTIVAEKKVGNVTWGKLKSGIGWISLNKKYVKRI